jgi:hypothetical protein
MKCIIEMDSDGMIYIPSFVKISRDIEGILRFCVSNMKDSGLVLLMKGIFLSAPLKGLMWRDIHTKSLDTRLDI